MSNQTKLALIGAAAFAVSKLYFKQETGKALLYSTAAMSLVALFRAKNTTETN